MLVRLSKGRCYPRRCRLQQKRCLVVELLQGVLHVPVHKVCTDAEQPVSWNFEMTRARNLVQKRIAYLGICLKKRKDKGELR